MKEIEYSKYEMYTLNEKQLKKMKLKQKMGYLLISHDFKKYPPMILDINKIVIKKISIKQAFSLNK